MKILDRRIFVHGAGIVCPRPGGAVGKEGRVRLLVQAGAVVGVWPGELSSGEKSIRFC
jgi:hypothetical protein